MWLQPWHSHLWAKGLRQGRQPPLRGLGSEISWNGHSKGAEASQGRQAGLLAMPSGRGPRKREKPRLPAPCAAVRRLPSEQHHACLPWCEASAHSTKAGICSAPEHRPHHQCPVLGTEQLTVPLRGGDPLCWVTRAFLALPVGHSLPTPTGGGPPSSSQMAGAPDSGGPDPALPGTGQ